MTQYKDADDLIMGGKGAPIHKFEAIGSEVKGTVVSKASMQQRDFTSGAPLFYDDGNPRMQVAITLQTDERGQDDDGQRRIFVKGQMLVAVRDAVTKAKLDRLEVGSQLCVRYVSDGEPAKKGLNAPKQYQAWVKPGAPVDDPEAPF